MGIGKNTPKIEGSTLKNKHNRNMVYVNDIRIWRGIKNLIRNKHKASKLKGERSHAN